MKRVRSLVKWLAVGACAVAVVLFALWPLGFRWNGSPSLPEGLYATVHQDFWVQTGVFQPEYDLVEFCPPQPWGYNALKRGYRDPGICADYGNPLMKPIAARAGDQVELTEAGIAVNGRLLPRTRPRVLDSRGRPMDHYPFGRYVVEQGQVWVVSSWNQKSFDSRYFGPVNMSSVRRYLRPVLTWGKPE